MEGDRKLVYVVEEDEHNPTPTKIKWDEQSISTNTTTKSDDQTILSDRDETKTCMQELKSFTLFTEDRRMSRTNQLMFFIGFLIAVMGSGEVGRMSTSWLWPAGHTWSEDLIRPPYAPPPQQVDFRGLWLLFYICIAFSGWRVCMRRSFTKMRIFAFVSMLLFNCLWVPLFYGWHQIFLALLDVALLLVCALVLFASFWKVEKKASFVLVPFILWVVYGVAVVAGYWWLNFEHEGFINNGKK